MMTASPCGVSHSDAMMAPICVLLVQAFSSWDILSFREGS